MAYGLWSMVYGLWSMAYGLWSMAHGLWSMAYGTVQEVESHLRCIEFRVRLLPSNSEVHVLLLEEASLLVCEDTSTETLLKNLSLDVSTDINTSKIRLSLDIRSVQ